MKVSCIIPCYNAGSTILRSVQSVLDQTVQVDEIIIIDDGSEANTKRVLTELKTKNDSILLITQENKGASAARNVGVKKSSHPYLLMLDADDTYEPTFIEKALPVIKNNDSLGVVMPSYSIITAGEEDIHRSPSDGSFEDYLFRNYGVASGLYARRALLEIEGYDEQMRQGYEDWELLIRLRKCNWEFHVLPEILYHYYNYPNSRNKGALKKDHEIKKYLFLKYKEDYVVYYDHLIEHFTNLIINREHTIIKRENSIDYRIGKAILAPLRIVKSWLS